MKIEFYFGGAIALSGLAVMLFGLSIIWNNMDVEVAPGLKLPREIVNKFDCFGLENGKCRKL